MWIFIYFINRYTREESERKLLRIYSLMPFISDDSEDTPGYNVEKAYNSAFSSDALRTPRIIKWYVLTIKK